MTIKGDIADIRYRNEENGFTIVVLDVDGEPVVCKGVFPPIVEGQSLQLDGKFILHPKFGRQFDAVGAKVITPTGVDGIVRYLGSGIIKGIGPALALRIVSMFGEKTFEVIEYTPHLLAKVSGISKVKATAIAEAYRDIKAMQDSVMFLQQYGITINTSLKIYKVYGDDTVNLLSSNPYLLIEDVDGIGFITADKIARNMGIKPDSAFRLRAGVVHTLKESVSSSGNTYLPKEELITLSAKLLSCDEQKIDELLPEMVIERKIKTFDVGGVEAVTLPSVYRAEYSCATQLVSLIENRNLLEYDVESDIKHFEKVNSISFHPSQKDAISHAINSGAVIITGGPGTGKTTIIKCILSICLSLSRSVICMAPTGRASKRMSEATGFEASTIHRALGLTPDVDMQNEEPLDCDVVIVDEFSMVDVFLFRTLLSRLREGTRLIMVGDSDQLPSVGAGNVLHDLIESKVVPNVRLTHIYRQSLDSTIVTCAHAVNRGEMPMLDNKSCDFFFMRARTPEEVADTVVNVASSRIPKYLNLQPSAVQVLCPLKQGVAGVINLNRRLQQTLNDKSGKKIETEDYAFYVGDKVMHTVNNYELEWKMHKGYRITQGAGVFNGDIGTVIDVDPVQNSLEVEFEDGRVVNYVGGVIDELMLAYSITVHKSQGSEFDAVVMPIVSGSNMILTRNLLYTAITRAKRAVVLVGDEYNVKKMVANDYIAKRYSALVYFINKAQAKLGLLRNLTSENDI